MNLGANIKHARKQKGWTQTKLAEMIGTHLSHINRIETERQKPSFDVLKRIADALNVSLDYLASDSAADYKEIQIEDNALSDRIKLLNSLEEEDRKAIVRIIDAFLTKKKIMSLVNTDSK